jgi:hypothetical protein
MRCALLWVLRQPSQLSSHLFLLQLWQTRGLGTAMSKEMTTTTMRLKKNLSEGFAFPSSLFAI